MGMRGHLRQITPGELERLRRNPNDVREFVRRKARQNSAKTKAALERAQEIAMKARAAGILSDPAEQDRVRQEILQELAGAGLMLKTVLTRRG